MDPKWIANIHLMDLVTGTTMESALLKSVIYFSNLTTYVKLLVKQRFSFQ